MGLFWHKRSAYGIHMKSPELLQDYLLKNFQRGKFDSSFDSWLIFYIDFFWVLNYLKKIGRCGMI